MRWTLFVTPFQKFIYLNGLAEPAFANLNETRKIVQNCSKPEP
jgi:hypothetical protein